MTYIMSDIHGCYNLYCAMLKKIKFSNDDTMYIIGDVIDRGDDGIKILLDIMNRENITLLMGNHEYIMAVLLSNIKEPIGHATALDDKTMQGLSLWLEDGGQPTFRSYIDLSGEEQKRIVTYLVKLPLYAELTVNQRNFILVHAGFDHFSLSKSLKDYNASELLFHRSDPKQIYFTDKTVIVGHTPTFDYGENYTGKILTVNRTINVDCGCVYLQSGMLGCLRLENLKEFYVSSQYEHFSHS